MASVVDDFNKELNVKQEAFQAAQPPSRFGPLETAVRSALHSPLDLVGVTPGPQLLRAQAEHPVASFLGSMAGYAAPYGGWAKASTKIPTLVRAMEKVGSVEKLAEAPFKARAAKEIVRFLPFEVGRTGLGMLAGPTLAEQTGGTYRGTPSLAMESAFDLGLIGPISGAFEAFKSAGKAAPKNAGAVPGADLSKPIQYQLRELNQGMKDGLVQDVQLGESSARGLIRRIKKQNPPKGEPFVSYGKAPDGTHWGMENQDHSARALNRYFKPSESEGMLRTKFIVSGRGAAFRSVEEMDDAAKRSGLDGHWQDIQYPRYIRIKGSVESKPTTEGIGETVTQWTKVGKGYILEKVDAATGKTVPTKTVSKLSEKEKVLTRNLEPLDSSGGWYYGKEKKTGLYVMARKFSADEWVMFKTDSPGKFVPDHQQFANMMEKQAGTFGFERQLQNEIGVETADTGIKFYRDMPLVDTRGIKLPRGNVAKATEFIMKKSGLADFAAEGSEAFRGASTFVKNYLAPTMFQFDNPFARKIAAAAHVLKDSAEGTAEKYFLGGKSIAKTKTLYGAIAKGAIPKESQDSIKALSNLLFKNPESVEKVWRAHELGLSIDDAIKKLDLDEIGVKMLRELERVDALQMKDVATLQKIAGETVTPPMHLHRMLSRTWKGSVRVPIREKGKVIAYVGGKNRRAAIKEAEQIAEMAQAEGKTWKVGTADYAENLEQDLKLLEKLGKRENSLFGELRDKLYLTKKTPRRISNSRKGMGGYIGETRPWTQEEFEGIVLKQLRDYQKYIAKLTHKELTKSDLVRLRYSDPNQFEQVIWRVNTMFGEQGEIARATNKFADTLLAPVLGKDSATKIVGTFNKYNFRFTLGFANVGYAMANALTFIQTAFPQLAFIATAAPERVGQYYHYFPVHGQQSNGIGMLDIFKLTGKSFRLMRTPTPVLLKHFERAAAEGVWDPKFIEEFVGEKAATILRLKDVLKGDLGFTKWLGAAADAIPSFSEKFARGHSFVLGHAFFRDVMGITDDELLYQLSKQFVEKTQFLYSTGDRARLITGPLGSGFGLFKNWIMHYMGWMAEYTGEGVLHGNWKPFLWMLGGTTAVGGIGALPLYSVADDFSGWATDESLMQHLYTMFGGTSREGMGSIADGIYYGLPAFFNFSIQNQVAAPGANFGEDAARLMSLAYLDRAKFLGKALVQGYDHWDTTGENPVRDARTRDLLMRGLAPKSLYRITQATQSAALQSLSTGYPITGDLSISERLMYGLGVNPRWVESRYKVSNELWNDQQKMRDAVSNYGQAWASAIEAKDSAGARNVIVRAAYEGVDISSVIKSGKSRLENGREELIRRQFDPVEILKYHRLGLQ